MSKQSWKGSTLLAPIPPTLVSVGDENENNLFTVAWCGLVNTKPPMTYVSVRPTRYSYELIKRTGELAINLAPAPLAAAVDRAGVYTGRKVNKWEKFGFTREEAKFISAPLVAECPISLECRVVEEKPLGTHNMFLCEIIGVDVDEKLLDKDGRLCIDRANLLAFAHGEYFSLGKSLGRFGFAVKKHHKKRNQERK